MHQNVTYVNIFSAQPPLRIAFLEAKGWLAEKNAIMRQVSKQLSISTLCKFRFPETFSSMESRGHSYRNGASIPIGMAVAFKLNGTAIQLKGRWHAYRKVGAMSLFRSLPALYTLFSRSLSRFLIVLTFYFL